MSTVHIRTRATKSGMRFDVRYRLGGGKTPTQHAGTFKTMTEADACRERIMQQIAGVTPITHAVDDLRERQRVYFARLGSLIKIGISVDPERRCRNLNAELLVSCTGGMDLERKLHERFAAHRVRGEWFHPVAELEQHIADLIEEIAHCHRKREGTRKRFETIARQNAELDAPHARDHESEAVA